MNDNVTVTIESEDDDIPEPSFITAVVKHACEQMDAPEAEINVQVVDDETIRELNKKYRNQDKSTNVLSFSYELPEWVKSNLKGDVVLCPGVIRCEAQRYQKSIKSRWAHMLVHGTLHLLGMTHENQFDQNKMEKRELEIMTTLGFDDPYLGAIQ